MQLAETLAPAVAVKCHGILIIAGPVERIGPAVESSAVVAAAATLTPWNCSAVAGAHSLGWEPVKLA